MVYFRVSYLLRLRVGKAGVRALICSYVPSSYQTYLPGPNLSLTMSFFNATSECKNSMHVRSLRHVVEG